MFFHARISINGKDFLRLDLTEAELLAEVIDPYLSDDAFFLDGKKIVPSQVTRVRVNSTADSSQQLLPAIKAKRAASRTFALGIADEWYVTEEGINVTDHYLARSPARPPQPDDVLLSICRNFARAARVLTGRSHSRPDFEISNEYDVQDLLHAFLRLHFDDVRPESWSPEYLGGSSRIDFVLPSISTVVETKMTRAGLKDAQLGSELAVDVARYSRHPTAQRLVCLIHDPEHRVKNPLGLIADLVSSSTAELEVTGVVVS